MCLPRNTRPNHCFNSLSSPLSESQLLTICSILSKIYFSCVYSVIHYANARSPQLRSPRCSVYIKHRNNHQTHSHYASCARCQSNYQRCAISMLKCPSHPRARQCNAPSVNAPSNNLASREAVAPLLHLPTSQIGSPSPFLLIPHEFSPSLTYEDFPKSTPPTHHPPALTISITVPTSLSSRGA